VTILLKLHPKNQKTLRFPVANRGNAFVEVEEVLVFVDHELMEDVVRQSSQRKLISQPKQCMKKMDISYL
jgi:hypothetical protein